MIDYDWLKQREQEWDREFERWRAQSENEVKQWRKAVEMDRQAHHRAFLRHYRDTKKEDKPGV